MHFRWAIVWNHWIRILEVTAIWQKLSPYIPLSPMLRNFLLRALSPQFWFDLGSFDVIWKRIRCRFAIRLENSKFRFYRQLLADKSIVLGIKFLTPNYFSLQSTRLEVKKNVIAFGEIITLWVFFNCSHCHSRFYSVWKIKM